MSENPIMTIDELRARRSGKWWAASPEQIPAWVADMDFRTPVAVRESVAILAEQSDFGYAYRDGIPPGAAVCQEFAVRMKQKFDWDVDPALSIALTDLVQGTFLMVQAYTEPGENVIVQGPNYDPFREGVEDSGRVMVVNHLKRVEDRWELDLDDLRKAAESSPLFMLCHPHNPTGRAFTRQELESIAEIVLEYDLVVASDEIWADFELEDNSHIPFASLSPEIAARTVTMYSAGKSFTIAGLRCAVMHFGSEELRQTFVKRFPPRGLGGHNLAGVDATIAAWRDGAEWFNEVIDILRENRRTVRKFLDKHSDMLWAAEPESTYFYWIDCSGLRLTDRTPAEHFKENGIVFSAGAEFGPAYKDYVRFNYATSPEILNEILARMAKAIEGIRRG